MSKSHTHERQSPRDAGPLVLARDKLVDGSGEPSFVLNCDIILNTLLPSFYDFTVAVVLRLQVWPRIAAFAVSIVAEPFS